MTTVRFGGAPERPRVARLLGVLAVVAAITASAPGLASAANLTGAQESYQSTSTFAGLVISQFDPAVSTTTSKGYFQNSSVQIFNAGAGPVELNGLSLQDFSGSGLTNDEWGSTASGDLGPIELASSATPPSGGCTTASGPVDATGCLQPGQYYLLTSSIAAAGTNPYPMPADQTYTQGFGVTAPQTAAATSTTEGSTSAYLLLVDGTADIGSVTSPNLGGAGQSTAIIDGIATKTGETASTPLFGSSTGPAPTAITTTGLLQRGDGGCTDTGANQSDWSEVTIENAVPGTLAGVLSNSTSPLSPCPDTAAQVVFTGVPGQVAPGQSFTVKVADETGAGTVLQGDSSGTATLTATDGGPVTLSCVDGNHTATTNGTAAMLQGYATFTCTVPAGTTAPSTLNLAASITTSKTGESYVGQTSTLTGATATVSVNAAAPAVTSGAGTVGSGLVIDALDTAGGDSDPGYVYDFVALFNSGTSPVSLQGLSLEYDQESNAPIDANGALACAYGWTSYITITGSNCASNQSPVQATGSVESLDPLPDVVVQPGQSFLVAAPGQNENSAPDLTPLPHAADATWNPTGYSSAGQRIQVANNLIALIDGTTSENLTATTAPAEPVVDSFTSFGENAGITESYYDPGVTYIRGEVGPYATASRSPYRNGGGCQDTNDNETDFTVVPPLQTIVDGPDTNDNIEYLPQNQMQDMSGTPVPCAPPTQLAFTIEPPSSTVPTSAMASTAFTVQVSSETSGGVVAGQDNATTVTLGLTQNLNGSSAPLTCVNSSASAGGAPAPNIEQKLSGSNGLTGTQVTTDAMNDTVSVQLVGGQATLDCSVASTGTGYSLSANGTSSTYGTLLGTASSPFAVAAPSAGFDATSTQGLVISEVDNGGGESYASGEHLGDDNNWQNSFVELFNSSSQPISLNGQSLQFFDLGAETSGDATGTATVVPNDLQANMQYETADGGGFPTAFDLHNVTLAPGQHYLLGANYSTYEPIEDGNGTANASVTANGGDYPLSDFTQPQYPLPVPVDENEIRFEDSPEEGSMWLLVNGTTPMASVDLLNPPSANVLSDQTLSNPVTTGPTVNQPVIDSLTQAGSDGSVVPGITYTTGFAAPSQSTGGEDEGYAYSRAQEGCQDTQNNALDISLIWSTSVTPHSMVSPVVNCPAVEAGSNVSPGLVIAGAYGGGGQTASYYADDFVEIENASQQPISLVGDSLQYFGPQGPGNGGTESAQDYQFADLVPNATDSASQCTSSTSGPVSQTGCLQPGQYYLVAGAGAGAGDGQPIAPVPDQTAPGFGINWPVKADADCPGDTTVTNTLTCDDGGLLILANTTTELETSNLPTGSAPNAGSGGDVIDALGVGAPLFSVGSPVGVPSDGDGEVRSKNGCADTNNNSGDFTEANVQHATFFNSNSAYSPCPVTTGGSPIYAFGYTPAPANTSGAAPVIDGETINPAGIAIGPDGTTYLADTNANTVLTLPFPTSSALATTFAGSFSAFGEGGDGGAATSATLSKPSGLAVDSSGNVFIADTGDNVVREVAVGSGEITAVAGNGTAGYRGDGGPGTSAELNQPVGLAVSGSGASETLYIADSRNDAIRELNVQSGTITTVAGTPDQAGYGGDGGPATDAELNQPEGVAVDADGNLFIADSGNNVIREVSENAPTASTITTVAGDYAAYAANGYTAAETGNGGPATSAQLDDPQAIAIDPAGDLFIADTYNNAIREVSAATGNISLVSDQPPTDPEGLAVDPGTGDLFVASTGSNEVTLVSGGIPEGSGTAAGEQPANQLIFTGEPNGPIASGSQFTVTTAEESPSGSVDTGDSATNVALTLLSPPNVVPGTLSCGSGNAATLSHGVATFTCAVSGPGQGYELEATTAGYESPAESTPFEVAYPVGPPSGVHAAGTSEGASITWNPVAGATGYDIYDATAPGAELASNPNDATAPSGELASTPAATVSGAGTSTATVPNLLDGQFYDFVVKAISAGGSSLPSAEVSATPVGTPAGPQAIAGDKSASLSWSQSPGATGYTVLVSTTSGQEQGSALAGCTVSGQTTTSCTVNGLNDGITYYFVVEATDGGGVSLPSTEVSAVPSTVPDAPTGVNGTAANGQVTVAWTAAAGEGSAVTGYAVYASTAAGGENTSGTPACATSASAGTPPADSCVITGLTNGTPEHFVVVATNANGHSAASTEAVQTPSTVPDAPGGVTATALGSDVSVSWSAPSNGGSAITGYEVYDATAAGTENPQSLPVCSVASTDTACTVSLTPGTQYYFVVVATNADGTSADSTEVSATPAVATDAPSAVTATAGSEQVTLSWRVPAKPPTPVTDYQVYASTVRGGENLSGPAACSANPGTSCSVSGLNDASSYDFVVVADFQDGSTAVSSEVSGTPVAAPHGVTATAANGQVTVSWSTAAGATGYQVFASRTPGGENLTGTAGCSTSATSCTVSGLTNGTPYYLEVVGSNPTGSSSPSAEVAATPVTVPGAPGAAALTPGNGQLSVSWNVPTSDGGSPITGYQVFLSTTAGAENLSGPAACATTSATTCAVSGLKNGTTYDVVVVAANAVGASAASGEVSGVPSTVPDAPTGVTISPAVGSATISWTAPASNGGSAVTGYEVFASTAKGGENLSGTPACSTASTSCSLTGLVPGTAYYFVVLATNVNGPSTASTEVGVTPQAAAGAVTGLAATAGNRTAHVSWTAPPQGSGISYTVYAATSAPVPTTGTPACSTTGTSCDIDGLTNGVTYDIVVVTSGNGGTAATSSTVSVVPNTVPDAPGGVLAIGASKQVTVTWTAPNDEGSAISGYDVYLATQPGAEKTTGEPACSSPGTSCTIGDLAQGATYYVVVTAVNADGTSGPSAEASAKTSAAPPQTTAARVTLPAGTTRTTVIELDPGARAGTVITVELKLPGRKRLKQAKVTVLGDHAYVYRTGALPNGTTTITFYVTVGKHLKLIRTEQITVEKKPK